MMRIIGNVYIYIGIILALVVFTIYFIVNNDKNKPVIIGFTAQLTGRQAELGVQERNGAQLAVEKINDSGGIQGRKIYMVTQDDFGIPGEAENADRKLINSGAIAIIGHATTEQTLAGLNVTNKAEVIMMGPTVSTPKLSGKDDYFFRIHPSFEKSSKDFAQYIYQDKGIRNIDIIMDRDNFAYSNTYRNSFSDKFKVLGGHIAREISFSSAEQPDFAKLLSTLSEYKSEALLIIASDKDTALISQKMQIMNLNLQLFSSPWAQTETLINNGGKAVEGMELEQAYDLNNNSEAFINFKSAYKTRFGNDPSFGAAYSYETMLVLAEALKRTKGYKEGLKEALLEIKNFDGLTDKISFDQFGDVERASYLTTIKNGKFIRLKGLNSADLEVTK